MTRFWMVGLLLAVGCSCEAPRPVPAKSAPFLVDAAWLRAHKADVVLVDLQKTKEDYEKGHIEGAAYIHVEQFRGKDKTLADADVLAGKLGALGIDADTHVVAYDNRNGYNAGWLWYTLHQLGHGEISLLDGNVGAFQGELVAGKPPRPDEKTYVARKAPTNVVDADWIQGNLGQVLMVDARVEGQYTGDKPKQGYKPGHIPGAVNLSFKEFVDERGNYVSEERARALTAHLPRDEDFVLYCNTYQAASFLHFQLRRAGFDRIKAFDGSIKLYQDASRPLRTGREP